jgi:uncharacterized protein YndB with AHSA1/START domain
MAFASFLTPSLTPSRKYYVEHILPAWSDDGDKQFGPPGGPEGNIRRRVLKMRESKDGRTEATRRQLILGGAVVIAGFAVRPANALAQDESGLSHGAESIHQEVVFHAKRKRVYEALTDAQQFDKVMRLGEAMRSMATGTKRAEIDRSAGGAFSIFGGYISGRQIELVPDDRIVQAWRPQTWKPGEYSIVKFELVEDGDGTKVLLDHRGFPDGSGEHLAAGWKANYWEPLHEYLQMPS